MPSDVYTDLTLGATGATYIAPADGWFYLRKTSTASGQYALFKVNGWYRYTGFVPSASVNITMFTPVKKGDELTIDYTLAGATGIFRFCYAEGVKHLA